MENIVAVIPARSGSKGVVDKNIKLLAGRPLLAYSIAVALITKSIDRVIVSTDSEHYARTAREYGAEVPFLRPPEISGDTSTDYEFVKHMLDWFLQDEGYQPEYLVHLRPSTPLREVRHIDAAINAVRKERGATALRSVHEMAESAYKMFEIEGHYLKRVGCESFDLDAANDPRQAFKKTYLPNGYVDVLISEYITNNKKLHGNSVIGHITPCVTEVDSGDDFEYLEYQIEKDPTILNNLFG